MAKPNHVGFLTHAGVPFEVPIEAAYDILLKHFFLNSSLTDVNAFHDDIERWHQKNRANDQDKGGAPA